MQKAARSPEDRIVRELRFGSATAVLILPARVLLRRRMLGQGLVQAQASLLVIVHVRRATVVAVPSERVLCC